MRESIAGAAVGAVITGVISLLIFFLGNFSTQETLERSIVESLSLRFDSIDTNMSYEQALETIYEECEDNKSIIDSLNAQLEEKESQIKNKDSQLDEKDNLIGQLTSVEEINKIIQTANEYWNNSDYVQAFSILNNIKDKPPEIEVLITDYTRQYELNIIGQVDNLKAEEKLDEASNIIKEAITILPNSQILKDKLEEIENSYPQNMTDVVPAYQSGGNPYKEYTSSKSGASESFSMGGIKYTNGITFNTDINIFDDVSWAVYNLAGKYNKLEFILCHVDGTDLGSETFLEIYYDGQLKEEISVTPDMAPKSVAIDISGVTQLKMQMRSSGGNGPLYGLGNPMIR